VRRLDVGESTIHLAQGDITSQTTDAIVNAANEWLAPGGGVCGSIHRVGGAAIAGECLRIGRCPPGDARVTTGGRLAAHYVIHAVGPVWRGGDHDEAALLASAYRASLARANELNLTSVAFPAISAGIYGFPMEQAARIALRTVRDCLAGDGSVRAVVFVLFDEATLHVFERALGEIAED
jgi:O-acetyl-ADP-ribose deacetylase